MYHVPAPAAATIGWSNAWRARLLWIALTLLVVLLASISAATSIEASRRPYGPRAPWNVPVDGLPRHPLERLYADRFWYQAAADPGNVNLSFEDYTYAVYHVWDATGLFRIEVDWETELDGQMLPWNPSWQPAPGSDAQIILLDPDNGVEWNLWQVSFKDGVVRATNANRVPGDYWTREVGFPQSRGVGIPYLAMLVRPWEIEQGRIEHALSMVIRNTDGERFVPPAMKLEHPGRYRNGIPEGMRFALDVTDEEIEDWVDSLPGALPQTTRRAARTIARALKEYGWFITDTGGNAQLQFESTVSTGTAWDDLGLGRQLINGKDYPRDLLDGLLTPERIHVIVPSDEYPRHLRARANW